MATKPWKYYKWITNTLQAVAFFFAFMLHTFFKLLRLQRWTAFLFHRRIPDGSENTKGSKDLNWDSSPPPPQFWLREDVYPEKWQNREQCREGSRRLVYAGSCFQHCERSFLSFCLSGQRDTLSHLRLTTTRMKLNTSLQPENVVICNFRFRICPFLWHQ